MRVVVGFDEAISTAILSFGCRLLKDGIESSQALCSVPEGSTFESLIAGGLFVVWLYVRCRK